MFREIERDSVPVQIVNYFLDSISLGELKENDRLPPERDLCEKMGVGRSTLREALRVLEMMNVIEKRNGGTYVRLQTENIIKEAVSVDFAVGLTNYGELVEMRNFMEIETAALAAENCTEEDIVKLNALCQKMRDSLNDIRQYSNYSTEFHIAIASATHNEVMAEIFEAIRYVMYDYQKSNMQTEGEVQRSFREHEMLLEALKNKDVSLSRQIMREHMNYTEKLYERVTPPLDFDP